MTEARDADVFASEAAAAHDALAAREASRAGTPQEAVSPDPATVGAVPAPDIFARRRVELGFSLEDVANQLKFSARQIEALEAGDFERLPGGAFARGMMRSYARLLKLEPSEIGAQLLAAGAKPQLAPEEAVSLRTPIPFSEGGKHVNLAYMVLSFVILAVVAFFAIQWYQESRGSGKLAFVRPMAPGFDTAAAPPAGPDPFPLADSPGTAVTSQVTTLASAGASPPAETHPLSDQGGAALPAAAPPASVPPATGPAAEGDKPPIAATSSGPGKRTIMLRFESESWVRIRAAKGAILLSQLNPGGTEKVVEGDPPFELTIGNAPRVRLYYNEKPVDLRPYFNVDVARLTLN